MGTIDPLIEQGIMRQAQEFEARQVAMQLAEASRPDNVRSQVEGVLGHYLGLDKRSAHSDASKNFPKYNRISSEHLHDGIFQFYDEYSRIRMSIDNRALGSEEGRKGGYEYIVSLPYNPTPVENGLKAYQRVGFLFQSGKLIAYAHFFDLGDGEGPLTNEDKDTLSKGLLFLDNKVIAILPGESGPRVGEFGNIEHTNAFLKEHLYGELEELVGTSDRPGTAHKETTPLDPNRAPIARKITRNTGRFVTSMAAAAFKGPKQPKVGV